jgi:NAD(P)-dependent dehydrogenase (short-subunit alcohol dehydrogenase family)
LLLYLVVGASSTIGSIIVHMLAARGLKVIGVCSGGNAEPVLRYNESHSLSIKDIVQAFSLVYFRNGAAGVFDRHKGGLKLKENLKV